MASVVRCMNEVTLRRAQSVLGSVAVYGRQAGIASRYATSQLGQLGLASPGVAKSSTSLIRLR